MRSADRQRDGNRWLAARHGKHRFNRMLHRWFLNHAHNMRSGSSLEED